MVNVRRKGKRFEYWVRDLLRKYFKGYRIERMPMSGSMEDHKSDILFKDYLPFSVECKNQEANKGIYDWWDQTKDQAGDMELPILFINRKGKRLAILEAEDFVSILYDAFKDGYTPRSKFSKPQKHQKSKLDMSKDLPFSKDKQLGKS